MPTHVDLSIVIVSWNVRELVLDCLASLRDAKLGMNYEVILVDNGSDDLTATYVRAQFPDTRVIAVGRNEGFAAGNNRGLARAAGRHVLLLNADTIVLRDQLEKCVRHLDANPDVGVVGPQLLNSDRSKQTCIHNTPTLVSELVTQSALRHLAPHRYPSKYHSYESPIDVEAVSGACLFVRGEVIDQVGLLDEDYFFFLEETHWCLRIRSAGWRVVHMPDTGVIHLQGRSSKKKAPLRTRIEYQRSRDLFFRKTRGGLTCAALRAIVLGKLVFGCAFAGRRRARYYRSILRWQLGGRPAGAGLRPEPS